MTKSLLLSLFSLSALAYGGLLIYLYLHQPRMLFAPGRELIATPAAAGLAFEEQWLSAEDGTRLHGWFLPHPDERGVILFSHGNAGNISHRLESLKIFHRLGWSVLIYDYRGYGRSEGSPDERGTYLDAHAAWRHLTADRGYIASRIVLFGRSLGGAVTARLAADTDPAGVIVESTFTSVPDLAAERYPLFPSRRLARYQYDTRSALASIHRPLLLLHGREDEIVPFHHAEQLLAAANGAKRLIPLRGGHNDAFLVSGDDYIAALKRFLDQLAPNNPAPTEATIAVDK